MTEETTPPPGAKVIHMVFHDGSGNPDDDEDHVRSENEIYYDEEIAPRLSEIAKLCDARGMSLVCDVEYEPGETGSTRYLQKDAGAKLKITYMASKCRANVDALVMGIYNMMEANDNIGVSVYFDLIRRWKEGKVH